MGLLSWLFGRKDSAAHVVAEDPDKATPIVEHDEPEAMDQAVPAADELRRNVYVPPAYTAENRRRAAFYDAERAKAAAQGKTVKQLRAGLLGREETKEALQVLLDAGEIDTLRLGRSGRGLTVALPDGRLMEVNTPLLRRFGIIGSRIKGTGYYHAGAWDRPDGMNLGLKREPNNEHDANAVALTRGDARPQKIGYVSKAQARFVAKELDAAVELVAHAVMDGSFVLVTTPQGWASLAQSTTSKD